MKARYINNNKKNLNDLDFHVLNIICKNLEIQDIINLRLVNKKFYNIFDYIIKNIKHIGLFHNYYDIKIINKKDKNYYNIKSYMFYNSINIFKENGYFFICKIYLNEIDYCNLLPSKGYLKFFLGPKIRQKFKEDNIPSFYFENIYHGKIIYKKKEKIKDQKYKKIYNRKYIIIRNNKTLPLSHMRRLYIKENKEEKDIYKFSDNYLFGPSTYYENDPLDEIKTFKFCNKEYDDDFILLATFNPKNIFSNNEITKEMISFVIRKEHLKNLDFDNNVFVIYNNKYESD